MTGQMNKDYYVYILTNKINTVLYTGITNNLERRIYEHKLKYFKGFTAKYNVTKLVYFEIYSDIYEAIQREKQIKNGSRQKKLDLVQRMNPRWKDLADDM